MELVGVVAVAVGEANRLQPRTARTKDYPLEPTVLVTGGAGYIGSHVVLALQSAGYSVAVVDNLSTGCKSAVPADTPIYVGDIDDNPLLQNVMDRHSISSVIHLAASISVDESVRDPLKYYDNNVASSMSLLRYCLENGIDKFIFSSSAAVYGPNDASAITEASRPGPISPYGRSKLMTEWMLQDAHIAHRPFRPLLLRYFNVAGADPTGRTGQRGQNPTHLIHAAISSALDASRELQIFGRDYPTRDGTCIRDYIHVSDLAEAHVAALRYLDSGGAPTVLNCGYGAGYSVLEVISNMEAIIGRRLRTRNAERRPGDPAALVADVGRIRELLNWRPQHADLRTILQTALDWQRQLHRV